jgi:hypothetical protein
MESMSSTGQHAFDDQYLVRYLLGSLPPEDAERLDELSISDGDFSWRLREVENDLVDAYVRSELAGETLAQFESFYMASDRGRQKVEFAEGLRRFQAKAAKVNEPQRQSFLRRMFAVPREDLRFGMGAVALLLVFAFLGLDDLRLRMGVFHDHMQQSSLERQLNEEHAANAEAARQLELARKSAPDLTRLRTLSLILPPPTRGMAGIKILTVPSGTDLVVLTLTLESADFPHYSFTLKDPFTGQVAFSSPELDPVPLGERYAVSASLPAQLLKQQTYIAEVVGLSRANASHAVGDYAFRVVLR